MLCTGYKVTRSHIIGTIFNQYFSTYKGMKMNAGFLFSLDFVSSVNKTVGTILSCLCICNATRINQYILWWLYQKFISIRLFYTKAAISLFYKIQILFITELPFSVFFSIFYQKQHKQTKIYCYSEKKIKTGKSREFLQCSGLRNPRAPLSEKRSQTAEK